MKESTGDSQVPRTIFIPFDNFNLFFILILSVCDNLNSISFPLLGDILLLGRTNMFRYNNPVEAAKMRQDNNNRSRLDLSRLSLIAASRENLSSSFYSDSDDNNHTSNSSIYSPHVSPKICNWHKKSIKIYF